MGLNIKNEQTVELVRELARRTGLSQTSAVEEAVRAKLAEVQAGEGRETRRGHVDSLLAELDHSLTARRKKQIRDDEKQLYDDHGLPRVIVDTSAIIAIALNEPARDKLVEALLDADQPRISAASLVEIAAVLVRRLSPEDYRRVERLIERLGIETVPFDGEQAASAARAYRDFGRGSGHRSGLNLGDCYAYGLADVTGEPLLYVGDDFGFTDVTAAVRLS